MNPSEATDDLMTYSYDELRPGDMFITDWNDVFLILAVTREEAGSINRITVKFLIDGSILTDSTLGPFDVPAKRKPGMMSRWPTFIKGIRVTPFKDTDQ